MKKLRVFNRAMEPETILKNGASLKSRMSRENRIISCGAVFVFAIIALIYTSCGTVSKIPEVVLSQEMAALIKKGNKVYLDIDKESVTGQYIVNEFNKWGYWAVVENVEDAHFKIQFHIEVSKLGYGNIAEGYGIIMTLDDKVVTTSQICYGSAAALNGFNSFKEVSKGIINKFFKKQFK
jgi:hypothetical protein